MNARRRDFLRPLVESLEQRRLLACEVFVRDRTLFIIGDATDNQIEIVSTHLGLRVICDGAPAGTFSDVQALNVQGFEGHDGMKFNAEEALGASALKDTDSDGVPEIVDFWGGPGFDVLEFVTGRRGERFELGLGAEADSAMIDVTDIATGLLRTHITTSVVESQTTRARGGGDEFLVTASPFAQLMLDGGEQADRYEFQFGRLLGAVHVVDGGTRGQDVLKLLGTEFAEKIELNGGGPDAWIAKWEGPDLNGSGGGEVAIESIEIAHEGIELGEVEAEDGDDDIRLDDTDGQLAAISMAIHGGAGNDQGSLFIAKQQSLRDRRPAGIRLIDGGPGDDRLTIVGTDQAEQFDIAPNSVGDSIQIKLTDIATNRRLADVSSIDMESTVIKAGDGDDEATFDVNEDGLVNPVDLLGGGGNDKLTIRASLLAELIEIIGVQRDVPDPLIRGTNLATGAVMFEASVFETEAITVDSKGGDDQIVMREVDASLSDVDWTIHTGGGNDTVEARLSAIPDVLHVLTGQGNDTVDLVFRNANVPQPPPEPDATVPDIRVDAGAGIDSVMLDVFGSAGTPPSDLGDVSANATLEEVLANIFILGVGQLAVLAIFPLGALDMAQAVQDGRSGNSQTEVVLALDGADVDLSVGTGKTQDAVLLGIHPQPNSRIDLDLKTGGGDDRIEVRSTSPIGPLDWTLNVAPGGGEDEVLVAFEHGDPDQPIIIGSVWNPCGPPGQPPHGGGGLSLAAKGHGDEFFVDFDLVGTPGPDDLQFDALFPAAPSKIVADIGIASGLGDDAIDVNVQSAAESIEQKVRIDSGAGADGVTVLLRRLANPQLPPNVETTKELSELDLRAGAGDDTVVVDLESTAAEVDQKVRIDLGSGSDRGRHTFVTEFAGPAANSIQRVSYDLLGGDGDDDVEVHFETAAELVSQKVRIDSGAGNDRVNVSVSEAHRDGLAEVIVGAGPGAGPHVKAFDGGTHAEVKSFFAYDPSFAGGVRVATGDVNGDGVSDIITGAGPGAGPHVKVFDGRTHAELASFFAYGAGFAGGVFVAAGDVNGDGRDDIITGADADQQAAGGHVKVFDGRTGAELQSFLAFPGFAGGVRVAAGDINGDGRDDIVTGAGPGAPGGHVKVFDGRTGSVLMSFLAYGNFLGGVNVGSGDVDFDGFADIITGADAGAPGGHMNVFSGAGPEPEIRSFFAYDPSFSGGVRVAAGDLNGDGFSDLITGAGPGAPGGHVKVFDGQTHAELRSFFAFDPSFSGGVFVAAGDLHSQAQPKRLELDLAIDSAGGADEVAVELSDAATEALLQKVRLNTGDGADRASVIWQKLQLKTEFPNEVEADVTIDTGGGNDRADVELQPGSAADNIYSFKLQLGTGNDIARYWVFGTELPALAPREQIDQAAVNVELQVLGGQGNDDIEGRIGFNRAGQALPLALGLARIDIDGGAGRDRLSLDLRGPILEGAAVDAVLRGGDGNDQVRARFDLARDSTGRLSAKVLGEAGNDELGLAVLNADNLDLLFALLDGGSGKDRCRTTPNVTVTNCP